MHPRPPITVTLSTGERKKPILNSSMILGLYCCLLPSPSLEGTRFPGWQVTMHQFGIHGFISLVQTHPPGGKFSFGNNIRNTYSVFRWVTQHRSSATPVGWLSCFVFLLTSTFLLGWFWVILVDGLLWCLSLVIGSTHLSPRDSKNKSDWKHFTDMLRQELLQKEPPSQSCKGVPGREKDVTVLSRLWLPCC